MSHGVPWSRLRMAATSSRDKTSGTRTGLFAPDEVAHEPELATDNLPIKEEKRAQGLVLCRSADPSDRGQVGQKLFNCRKNAFDSCSHGTEVVSASTIPFVFPPEKEKL